MHVGKLVFAQLMDQLPRKTFSRIVERYGGDHRVRDFSCANQFRCMAFAQLTYRESLRDIVTCLRAHSAKLYDLGIRGAVARSTLADAIRIGAQRPVDAPNNGELVCFANDREGQFGNNHGCVEMTVRRLSAIIF